MEKINLPTATKNLKKNFPLLLSTVAALCLFLSPSATSLLVIAAVFVAVFVLALLDHVKPTADSSKVTRWVAWLISLLTVFIGYYTFTTTWRLSDRVAFLANALHLTAPILLFIVGLIGCAVGFYAMYVLSCWVVTWATQLLEEWLPVQEKSQIVVNLKQNWYFPISVMAFFFLNVTLTLGYFIGLLIVFMISLAVASRIPSILSSAAKSRKRLHAVAIMTALGICWAGQSSFYADWSTSSKIQALEAMLPVPIDIPGVVSVVAAVVAIFFVYICVLVFWKEMAKIISDNGIFDDVKIPELIVYGILIVASVTFVIFSFAQTEAFYGTEYAYDIIYTSDSPSLIKGNVYLDLTHPENDIRQPLFAVFAAPFVGIPYLFGKLLGASASVQAILVNIAQIIMLFAANFILSKMMKLDPLKRACFLLTFCTYTQMLFTLMMEQYIVAFFWLVFCMYLIAEKRQPDRIALWGAGGTLLTGMILLPFMSAKSPIRDFKSWFTDMVKYGFEFVALTLCFCRFDVFFNLWSKISFLNGFTGKTVTFADKLYQYTNFICGCFAAPDAGVNTTAFDHISWQLNVTSDINFVGVLILALAIFSAFWNRDKKSSLLAAGWVGFSAVMLLGFGWGTQENGLILYALYFGWAFLVLLFQLVEKIESKLNVRYLTPVFSVCAVVALLIINIPSIMETVNFAITFYPA